MSYEISYRRQAFILPAARAGYYDDICFLIEETGSNNCYEIDNTRRIRDWGCLAAGPVHDCLGAVTRTAASCCSGCLSLNGRRDTTPESYIKEWRRALADAPELTRDNLRGFNLELYVVISAAETVGDRRYAFEALQAQTDVEPLDGHDPDTGRTEWRFNLWDPEQVRLWLDVRLPNPGWKSVRATGH